MTFDAHHKPSAGIPAQPAARRATHHSIENEAAVLGSILIANPLLDRLLNENGLRPHHFTGPRYRQIFEAMLTLADDNQGIDPLTVANRLDDLTGQPLTEIDRIRIDQLAADTPDIFNVGAYADELIRLYLWRQRRTQHQAEADAIAREDEDAYQAARHRADRHEPERGETLDGQALLARFDENRAQGTERLIGLPWPRLENAMLGGARRGDTTLLAAHSSHGKSIAVMEWCEHIADQGGRVAIYTNELNPDDYAARLLAGRTGIPFSTIMRGWFTDTQLAEYRAALARLTVRLVPVYGWPWQDVARHVRRSKWDLCSLDLFNRLPGLTDTSKEDDAVNGLCNAASQTDGHLVIVSQLRKGGSARSSTGEALEPSGADLRGSGMLYNSPANVLFLHRDQEQVDDTNVWMRLPTGAIWADKIRNGAPGGTSMVRVSLNEDRMRFEEPGRRPLQEAA